MEEVVKAEKELTLKQKTNNYKKLVREELGNNDVKFIDCAHVEAYELPAVVNIYVGKNIRVFLCNICCSVAGDTINRHLLSEKLRERIKTLDEQIGEATNLLLKVKSIKPKKWYQFWRK